MFRFAIAVAILFLLIICLTIYLVSNDDDIPPNFSRLFSPLDNNIEPQPKKIAIITIEKYNDPKLRLMHNESMNDYSDRHDYKYFFFTDQDKFHKIREILNEYDYVLYLDTSTIICHPEISLEFLIDQKKDSDIFVIKDYQSTTDGEYSDDVFMVKSGDIGKKFIDLAVSTTDFSMNKIITTNIFFDKIYQIPEEFCSSSETTLVYGTVILHIKNREKAVLAFGDFLKCMTEFIPPVLNQNPPKICLLLTMYVSDDKNRRDMYERNVLRWINESNIDIFTVDSSGRGLRIEHPRLHQFIFDQGVGLVLHDPSVYEKKSILSALEHFFVQFSNYDIIFKLTGKYFVPDFEKISKFIPSDAELVVQNSVITHGQNTELLGCRYKIMKNIINLIDDDTSFELMSKKIVCSKKYKTYRIPQLKLDQRVKRGDGSYLLFL